jgi:hypothetical protein
MFNPVYSHAIVIKIIRTSSRIPLTGMSCSFAFLFNSHSFPNPFAIQSLLQISSYKVHAIFQHGKIIHSLHHNVQVIPNQWYLSIRRPPFRWCICFSHEITRRGVRCGRILWCIVFRIHLVCTEERPGENIFRDWFDKLIILPVGRKEGKTRENQISFKYPHKSPPFQIA